MTQPQSIVSQVAELAQLATRQECEIAELRKELERLQQDLDSANATIAELQNCEEDNEEECFHELRVANARIAELKQQILSAI